MGDRGQIHRHRVFAVVNRRPLSDIIVTVNGAGEV